MAEGQIIQVKSLPGIKRDGTQFEGDYYVDGMWCRWERGLPRKIGGYRSINKYLSDVARTLHAYTRNRTTYVHAGSATKVERFYIDGSLNTSVIADRTPTTLTASENNLWQFDVDSIPGGGDLQLIAQVAPNGSCLCNSTGGQLFYGDLFGTGALTEVTAFPTGYNITGGVFALHPFTVGFGSDGYVMWSPDPTDFTVSGASFANVTGQKIVRGMAQRGGPGNSPSGLLWSADSLLRMSYIGGTTGFQFDTISAQSSIMSAQSVIEYDGVFYWIGTDRFLQYNGVVREVDNPLNSNFFFDNLNYAQRQRVFAHKVPRRGEIWWCFPFGDSEEPNWAIIYNVRENTWYDTPLPNGGRGASVFPAVFRYPLMSGVTSDDLPIEDRWTEASDERITEEGETRVTNESGNAQYRLWVHEIGTDEIDGLTINPIRSYFETADISLPTMQPPGQKNAALRVEVVEPDFVQSGDMTLRITGRANARSVSVEGPVMTIPETPTTPQEQVVYFKEQRRQLRFKFESDCLGGDYQMGHVLAHVSEGDGTMLGAVEE